MANKKISELNETTSVGDNDYFPVVSGGETKKVKYKNVVGSSGVTSVNGKTGVVTLTKSDISLGNVDNTSDANKPVSTAQATAIGAKLDKAGDTMSGALAMGSNKITGLANGTNSADAVNKGQLDSAIQSIGTVFTIKGDVATVNDLPASGNSVGDVWYVQSVSAGYIWLETTEHPTGYWEELGEPIDLSGYIEKPSSPATGSFLVYDGSAWIAQTLSTWQGGNY